MTLQHTTEATMTKVEKIQVKIQELKAMNDRCSRKATELEANPTRDNCQAIMLLDSGIYQRKQMIKRLERKLAKIEKRS
jgi:predicted RNase H-like nuclease (RuvC/YqgF family)